MMTNLKEQLRKSLEERAEGMGVQDNLDVKVAIEYVLAGKRDIDSAIAAMEAVVAEREAKEAAAKAELERTQAAANRYNNYVDAGKGKKRATKKERVAKKEGKDMRLQLVSKKEFFGNTRTRQAFVKLTVLEDGFDAEVIEVQTSAYLRNMETEVKAITIDGFTKTYKNFNSEIIVMSLSGLGGEDSKAYINFFNEEVYVSEDLNRLVVKSPETGALIDYNAKAVVNKEEVENFMRFKPAFMSPAQEKKMEATCIAFDGDKEAFENRLDEISNGMYSTLKEEGNGLSYEKLVKVGANFAQGLAPSAEMVDYACNGIAIMFSKTKREFADGGGFFVAKDGFPVGTGAQMRNLGSDKWFGLGIKRRTMAGIIDFYGDVIYIPEVTEVIQRDLAAAFKGEGPYAEKTVILGIDHGTPDCFIDLNILKTPIDFTKGVPSALRVLDLAGPSKDEKVTFGSQMCFSLLLNKEGRELMKTLLQETVESLFDDYEIKTPKVMGFDEFEKSLNFTGGIINTINPEFARMDRSLKRSNEKALSNAISWALSEYQAKVSGKFCRALADFGAEFGVEILAENEVFSLDLPAGEEVVGIRSPKGGIKEQGVYRNVELAEILERIEMFMDKAKAKVAAEIFSSIRKGSGVVVVPSTDLVKLLHSGMDFDFDGMTFITDRRVVGIMKAQKPVIVEVTDEGNANVSDEKFGFGADYMTTLIDRQFNNGNEPVGIVCNHNHSWVMLLGDLKLARKVLADRFGNGKELDYDGLTYEALELNREFVKIDGELTLDIIDQIRAVNKMAVKDEVIVRVIEDINVMMNRYIQKTIDASKSGEKIEIPECLLANNIVKTASLSSINFLLYGKPAIDEEGAYAEIVEGKFYVKINTADTTYKKVKVGKVFMFKFSDVYHDIRREVARFAANKFRKMVKEEVKLDDELMLRREAVEYSKPFFVKAKGIYGDMTSDRAIRSEGKRMEERAAINKDFRETVGYLANTVRMSTAVMDAEERALAAMDVATKKDESVYAAPSTFPSVVLAEEYVALAASHSAGINFVGERIKGDNLVDGQKVSILNGYRLEGFACDTELPDGTYVVREYDGQFYITRTVKEMLAERLATDSRIIVRLNGGEDFEAVKENILAAGNKVEISTWKKFGDKDSINGFALDLPKGKGNYNRLLDGMEANADKLVISQIRDRNGEFVDNMFVCMTSTGTKVESIKEKLAKRKPAAIVKNEIEISI